MHELICITNDLNKALQQTNIDIVNALSHFTVTKNRLKLLRASGWLSVLSRTTTFCSTHMVDFPGDMFLNRMVQGRPCRNTVEKTNIHHYRVNIFLAAIDTQISELTYRFCDHAVSVLSCASVQTSFLNWQIEPLDFLQPGRNFRNDASAIKLCCTCQGLTRAYQVPVDC